MKLHWDIGQSPIAAACGAHVKRADKRKHIVTAPNVTCETCKRILARHNADALAKRIEGVRNVVGTLVWYKEPALADALAAWVDRCLVPRQRANAEKAVRRGRVSR